MVIEIKMWFKACFSFPCMPECYCRLTQGGTVKVISFQRSTLAPSPFSCHSFQCPFYPWLSPPLLLYPFPWIYYSLSMKPKAEVDYPLWASLKGTDYIRPRRNGENWKGKRELETKKGEGFSVVRQQKDFNSFRLAALCLHPRTHAPHINMPLQNFFFFLCFVFVCLFVSLCVAVALAKPQLGNAPGWLKRLSGILLSL